MSLFTNPNRIPENYGIKVAAGLILFFVSMRLIGYGNVIELRLLNVFILVAGVYFALKKFKSTHEDHLNYFRALITGVATGAVGSVIFAVFMFLYLMLDASLMQSIVEKETMGRFLNPYMIAFIAALEGVFSGLLATFVMINFVTTDDVNDPAGESK